MWEDSEEGCVVFDCGEFADGEPDGGAGYDGEEEGRGYGEGVGSGRAPWEVMKDCGIDGGAIEAL